MKTIIHLNREKRQLELRHITNCGHVGRLVIPLDGATAIESVSSPLGGEIHYAEFPAYHLGDGSDLEPYLVGMTLSAVRRVAA